MERFWRDSFRYIKKASPSNLLSLIGRRLLAKTSPDHILKFGLLPDQKMGSSALKKKKTEANNSRIEGMNRTIMRVSLSGNVAFVIELIIKGGSQSSVARAKRIAGCVYQLTRRPFLLFSRNLLMPAKSQTPPIMTVNTIIVGA